jgi:sugar O-acyltransferase (sialic acid O-acetyltransferase NeuD family)
MKKLYIVGAGGFGREVYAWIKQHPEFNKSWVLAGFLDDNLDALNPVGNFASVALLKNHQVSNSNVYICALGLPLVKSKLLAPLIEQKAEFISFIHPTAVIGERVKMGRGVVVCPGASISVDISIGDFSMIGPNTTIGHDGIIGAWCTLCAQCDVTGRVTIGDGVFLGSRVSIIPSKKVGSKSILGAGSVVISDVPEGVTVVGNPARIL